jgi:hypothetical protein
MRSQFVKGALVGGLSGALVMVASGALAGSGIGGVFNLGVTNSVNRTSVLVGKTTGSMLRVRNNGTGPAAAFQVAAGKAPFGVNSNVKVKNLNADLLDGIDSTGFYAAGSKVVDSAHADNADQATNASNASNANHATNADDLGGVPASGYQQSCSHGSVFAFAPVAAAGNFSNTFTQLSNAFNCSGDRVFAKRVNQGDYRVLICGVPLPNNPLEPFALATDQSFNDFVSLNLVEPPDPDVQQTCGGFDSFSEFKVTTRDASGNGKDNPFIVAQI